MRYSRSVKTLLVINELGLTQEEIAQLPVVLKARAVLVTSENMIVMTRERGENNMYIHGVPGGKLEPGEILTDGLVREIKEETGYDCEILAELGGIDVMRPTYVSRSMFWLARTIGGQGALAITEEERVVDFECVEYSYEQGMEIIEREYAETKHDISQRALIALQMAKELLKAKKEPDIKG
jgi:ADP-ribose pyrophosphatase YjhB (NUDIX family)